MVAEPHRLFEEMHRITRADGTMEICLRGPREPSLRYIRWRYNCGGSVQVVPAAWPGQWIVVVHPR